MPKGELYIRKAGTATWKDAYEEWGVSFTDGSLSLLMTPAPNKSAIENASRLQHGKRVIRSSLYVRKDEREVSLQMHITARNKDEFWRRYEAFCSEVLDYGFFDLKHRSINSRVTSGGLTRVTPKIFRMTYVSCEQFSEFAERMAKFVLTLNEPDPTNRGLVDSWNSGYTFTEAETSAGDSPVGSKLWEEEQVAIDGELTAVNYILSGDETAQPGKTYYQRTEGDPSPL